MEKEAERAVRSSGLLACPFCGGEANLHVKKLYDIDKNLHWYTCANKECDVGFSVGEWTESEARKKWNRRAG